MPSAALPRDRIASAERLLRMAAEIAGSKAFQPQPQIMLSDEAVKVMAEVEAEAKEHALLSLLADSPKMQGITSAEGVHAFLSASKALPESSFDEAWHLGHMVRRIVEWQGEGCDTQGA